MCWVVNRSFLSRKKTTSTGNKICSDESIYVAVESPCEYNSTNTFGILFANTAIIDEQDKDGGYPCLSKEKQLSINEIMSSKKKQDIIVTNFDINITTEIFQQLNDHNLLDDEIVNDWVGMLKELDQAKALNQYCCNTWYYVKIENNHFEDDYCWLSKVNINIFQLDSFILPMNISNTYWMFVIVYPKKY